MKTGFVKEGNTAENLLANAQEGILIAEVESKSFRYANKTICDMFGYSYEEMIELSVLDIHPPELLADVIMVFEKQARGEIRHTPSIPCLRKDGTIFWADINTSKMNIQGIDCNVGFFTDVTGRVKAQQALQEALASWKSVFNAIPHPAVILDQDNTITAANKRLCVLANKNENDITGNKCWTVFHGKGCRKPPEGCPVETMRKTGRIESADMEVESLNGHYIVSCTPILDSAGNLKHIIHIATDITDRKKAEKELAESLFSYRDLSNTLEAIFDAIPDILGVQDLEHGILRYNKAGYKYLGLGPEETHGKKCFELIGRKTQCDTCATSEVYKTKKPARVERHIEELGRWLEIRSYPVLNQAGKLVRVIEHLRDITDSKNAEAEKESCQHRLQQKQKLESLGELAGGIAHDFNNLLTGIFGYMDMAKSTKLVPEAERYLSAAAEAIHRARSLTNQLLTFARGGTPRRETGKLNKWLAETVSFSLSGSNISPQYFIDENLWSCDFDRNQLAQAIDNLIINACQAMGQEGKLSISARNIILESGQHAEIPKGEYVQIGIQDNGCGIPADVIHRIFDPFFTTREQGSGLGLATSYSIIKKHNGHIEVTSRPPAGTTFFIYLPKTENSKLPEKNDPAETTETTRRAGNILIMDDEELIRETMSMMLSGAGFTVTAAKAGEEALKLLKEHREKGEPFDVVILDLTVVGGMGGKETVRKIRKDDQKTPVIVSSGYAEDPILQNPQEYGFTDSIQKPFVTKELTTLLSKYV